MPQINPSFQSQIPLLRTKLLAPQISPEFVRRPRLVSQINRGVKGPLTMLSAPAGFGKTHLLVEWSENTQMPLAWLTLDSEDNDPDRFLRYMIGAFRTLQPDLGEEVLDYIPTTQSSMEAITTLLINEISSLPQEFVLVMDDFHLLENPEIIAGMTYFIKHLPHNLHLALASRCEPDLDLALFRARGQLVELDAGDLRFRPEEVTQFFEEAMGLNLQPETISALENKTDGWITGLQMAALSLRQQGDATALLENLQGDGHFLVDYLAEEVLDQQPEEIRQFLLRTSILDSLTGSLCEAVAMPGAQPGYGAVMLDRLEHANLFISALDEKHEWFRYHPLFGGFLNHVHAEINPAEIPQLQKRAALWFEKNGDLGEAYRYAFASGDLDWTADLIRRNIPAMIKVGELASLNHWLAKLPKKTIQQSAGLSLAYAWGLIVSFQLDNALVWISDISENLDQSNALSPASDPESELPDFRHIPEKDLLSIRGGLAICQSFMAMLRGDAKQAADFSRQAADYLGDEPLFIQSLLSLENSLYHILSGNTQKAIESLHKTIHLSRQSNNLLVAIIAACQLADMQMLQGKLNQAWFTLQKIRYLAVGPDEEPLELAKLANAGFGEILLERNELEEASKFLESVDPANRALSWLSDLDNLIALARLRQAQGDSERAQVILGRASRLAASTESSQWDDTLVTAVTVRTALLRNDLATAIQAWNKNGFPEINTYIRLENYPYHIYEYLMITQICLLVTVGRIQKNQSLLQQSLDLLDYLLPEAERFQRVTSVIEISIQQAIALSALGRQAEAVTKMRKALALGEGEGFRRVYLDGGQPVADLLQQCLIDPTDGNTALPSRGFIESLLSVLRGSVETPPTPDKMTLATLNKPRLNSKLIDPLTARELEVLQLMAKGKSNQEISSQLYLTLNTVKRHAYNIYAKLEVRNRTEAVEKARHLKLLV